MPRRTRKPPPGQEPPERGSTGSTGQPLRTSVPPWSAAAPRDRTPSAPEPSEPGEAKPESMLASLLSLSATALRRRGRTSSPSAPEPSERGEARPQSMLASLLSLSATALPWRRRTPPPDREPPERGETGAQSMLGSLLSLSATWIPRRRRVVRPRRGEVKAAIMAALAQVDYYEHPDTHRPVDADTPGARSVGLSYREIQRRVRAAYPGSRKVSMMTIRSYARDAKGEGRAMPYRRPYSTRKTIH